MEGVEINFTRKKGSNSTLKSSITNTNQGENISKTTNSSEATNFVKNLTMVKKFRRKKVPNYLARIKTKALSSKVVNKNVIKRVLNKKCLIKKDWIKPIPWDEWKKKGKVLVIKNIQSLLSWLRKERHKTKVQRALERKIMANVIAKRKERLRRRAIEYVRKEAEEKLKKSTEDMKMEIIAEIDEVFNKGKGKKFSQGKRKELLEANDIEAGEDEVIEVDGEKDKEELEMRSQKETGEKVKEIGQNEKEWRTREKATLTMFTENTKPIVKTDDVVESLRDILKTISVHTESKEMNQDMSLMKSFVQVIHEVTDEDIQNSKNPENCISEKVKEKAEVKVNESTQENNSSGVEKSIVQQVIKQKMDKSRAVMKMQKAEQKDKEELKGKMKEIMGKVDGIVKKESKGNLSNSLECEVKIGYDKKKAEMKENLEIRLDLEGKDTIGIEQLKQTEKIKKQPVEQNKNFQKLENEPIQLNKSGEINVKHPENGSDLLKNENEKDQSNVKNKRNTLGKIEKTKRKKDTLKAKERSERKRKQKKIMKKKRTELLKKKLGPMRQLYEMFSKYLLGKVPLEDAVEICRIAMSNKRLCIPVPSVIADTITVLDCETSALELSDFRKKVLKLCKSLEQVVSQDILLERLEMDSLLEFDLIPTKQFLSRSVKIKTKLFYKQKKFNLYREESEGYSKMLVELSKASSSYLNSEYLLGHIKSLIGYFNLDPNRVLDAILNALELRPTEKSLFVSLLNIYVRDKNRLREVLGFRYAYYHKKSSGTPKSVYVLTAILIQEDILTLDDVLVWLHPDESDITNEMNDRHKSTEKKSIVRSSPGSPMKIIKMAGTSTELYSTYLKNQKLVLCETFLEMGDWENFKTLMKKIGPRYVISYPPVALSLCKLIHYLIDPLYLKHFKFGPKMSRSKRTFNVTSQTPEQINEFVDLKTIFPMFYALKSALGYDPILLFKISRVMAAGLEAIEDFRDPDLDEKTVYYDGITLLDEVLLPTLTRLNSACCASETIWKLLKLYPFSSRYALYGRWKNTCEVNQTVIEKKNIEEYNIKVGMKRVSKENVKQVGRLFGKATHFCPPALFNYILNMVSMYDNLIGPVVEALRYLNTTSCDVLGYCILDFFLKEKTKKSQTDGHTLAQWFQNIALFSALSHKKLSIDVSGIIHYVGQELVNHNCIDLLLLKELLLKVTGIEIGDDLPNHQYGANGDGELSKSNETANCTRNFKRSSIRLREALSKLNLTAPLAIMLAQERNRIAHESNEDIHIKLLGRLYDECHDVLLQFGTYLYTSAMIPELREFPNLDELISVYNLDIDAAFFLSKPGIYRAVHETLTALKQDKTKPLPNSFVILSGVINSLAEVIIKYQPQKVWEEISPNFVVLFWSLNLYDIYAPPHFHGESRKGSFQVPTILPGSRGGANFASLETALKEQKDTWFVPGEQKPAKNDVITSFLQLCILRRCIFSPSDALYCAQFIQLLHKLRAENFSTLLCYDRLLCDITYMATSCTENEARRYGQFLLAVLQDVMRWHSSKDIYDRECELTPGFVTKYRGSLDGTANDNIQYENYRHVCHKWHFKLTKSLLTLLESKEYVQIRNGMIILIKLLPQFPMISKLAQCIEKGINKIKEDEKKVRQDLYTLAVSYSGQLSAKMKSMIKESDFHKVVSTTPSFTSSVQNSLAIDEKCGESLLSPTIIKIENKYEKAASKQKKSSRFTSEESESKGNHKSKEGKSKHKDKELKLFNEALALEKKVKIALEALAVKEMLDLEKGKESKQKESKSKIKEFKIKEALRKEKENKEVVLEKKDKDRKEKEKKDKEQKEKERKEKDLKEKLKKELKEREMKEKELKERLEKEYREKERKEKELKEKEKERKEKELMKEKERKEKEVKVRKDKELKEKKEKEKEIKERERKEKDKEVKEKDRKEKELKEKDRKDRDTSEKEKKPKDIKKEKENKDRKDKEGKEKEKKEFKVKEKKEKEGKKDKEPKEKKEKDQKEKKEKKDAKEKEKKENDTKEKEQLPKRKGGSPINWSSSSEGYESPEVDTSDRKREIYLSMQNKLYKREPLANRRFEGSYYHDYYSDEEMGWYDKFKPLPKEESSQILKRSVSNNYYTKSNVGVGGVVTVDSSKRRKVEMPSASKERTPGRGDRKSYTSDSWKNKWR